MVNLQKLPGPLKFRFLSVNKKEVSLILDFIYTGNFSRPGLSENRSWIKLLKAAKIFEMEPVVKECWNHIAEMPVNEVVDIIEEKEASLEPV